MKNNNDTLSWGQKSKFPAMALGLSLAMAAPTLAYTEWDNGSGTDILWSTAANWSTNAVPGVEKAVIGELNYPSPSENVVTLNTASANLEVFEVYGGGTLNIVSGGILTVTDDGDAEFKIYTGANGTGDLGSRINLLGGTIVIEEGVFVQLGDLTGGLFGGNGSNVEGIGWTKVTENGFTTYTGIPAPSSTLEITSITKVGAKWELKLEGEAGTAYEFESSTTLVLPGTQVTGLTATLGVISGGSDEIVTTDGTTGKATVQMSLGAVPANFVRAVGP